MACRKSVSCFTKAAVGAAPAPPAAIAHYTTNVDRVNRDPACRQQGAHAPDIVGKIGINDAVEAAKLSCQRLGNDRDGESSGKPDYALTAGKLAQVLAEGFKGIQRVAGAELLQPDRAPRFCHAHLIGLRTCLSALCVGDLRHLGGSEVMEELGLIEGLVKGQSRDDGSGIGGEAHQLLEARSDAEEGNARSGRKLLDRQQHLLAHIHLVRHPRVQAIQKQNDRGAGRLDVGVDVLRQRRAGVDQMSAAGLRVAILLEEAELLRLSVFEHLELIAGEIPDRLSLGVGDDDIHHHLLGEGLKAVARFGAGRIRGGRDDGMLAVSGHSE